MVIVEVNIFWIIIVGVVDRRVGVVVWGLEWFVLVVEVGGVCLGVKDVDVVKVELE